MASLPKKKTRLRSGSHFPATFQASGAQGRAGGWGAYNAQVHLAHHAHALVWWRPLPVRVPPRVTRRTFRAAGKHEARMQASFIFGKLSDSTVSQMSHFPICFATLPMLPNIAAGSCSQSSQPGGGAGFTSSSRSSVNRRRLPRQRLSFLASTPLPPCLPLSK